MDLVNKQVSHKKYGIGTIEAQNDNHLTVKFANEVKKFQYPIAFESFLQMLDQTLNDVLTQAAILKLEEQKRDEVKRVTDKLLEMSLSTKSSPVMKTGRKKLERDLDRSKDILSIHQNCFDFLINYQKEHNDFYFIPRKMNNSNRLDDGYYFIGNNAYLMISFWVGGDGIEKIHNFNFGITENEDCFFEISSRDNEKKANHLRELVGILEKKHNYKFDEVKVNKWRLEYDENLPYLEGLESFIDNEKVIIDEYLRANNDTGIVIANQETHEKYVKKILDKQFIDKSNV